MSYDEYYGLRYGNPADVTGMMFPVRCNHCQGVYDSAKVEVTGRYADCSVFITPCCKRQVDDRPWVSFPAFRKLGRDGYPERS